MQQYFNSKLTSIRCIDRIRILFIMLYTKYFMKLSREIERFPKCSNCNPKFMRIASIMLIAKQLFHI